VISARSGSEALAALPLMSSTPDLMITDIVMPDLNGIELARRVVEAFAAIRVLYISGYTEDAIVHHGILQEGVELLQKPFTATDLLQKVSGMLEAPPEPASGA
jgi:YesN/AraC family two-component response regulator